MISMEVVRDTLLDIAYISNIKILDKGYCIKKGFCGGVHCEILLKDRNIKIFIGVPMNWMRDLISIYICDYKSLPFIPHIEADGKMCLFDIEGVIIDNNFVGILKQCINKAKNVLEIGIYQDNTKEFIKEFSAYWSYLKPKRVMKFALPNNHKTQIIRYSDPSLAMKLGKNEKFSSLKTKKENSVIFAAAEQEYFSIWNIKEFQKKGLFIYIEPQKYILPPDFREQLHIDFVKALLDEISIEDIKKIETELCRSKLIVFEIKELSGEHICLGFVLQDYLLKLDENKVVIKQKGKYPQIIPIDVFRVDDEFLTQRTMYRGDKKSPRILMIGCGSIGGYLCIELIKSGIKCLDIVDNDKLSEENIYRHYLGIEYVGKYKAEALRIQCCRNFPMLNINSIDSKVEEAIEEGSIQLDSYDIIISATGNHNFNRWLNKKVHKENIKCNFVYLWKDHLDLGCHFAVIQNEHLGCYECFFRRDGSTNELYDATAYSFPGQSITKNNRGCAGSFVPYSSNVSLRVVSACMEWINRIIAGRYESNVLVSIKGEAYNFISEGYKCSETYYNQIELERVIHGSEFEQEKCDVCGENVDDS